MLTLSEAHPIAGGDVIVKAQLADVDGNPVATSGVIVVWSGQRKGAITPDRSATGPDGSTAATLTTDTSVTVNNFVEVFDAQGIRGFHGPITTVAGPPAAYVVTPSNNLPIVGSTIAVNAQITDKYHNATKVADRVVTWTSTSGGASSGSLTAPTSLTNANGVASNSFVVGLSTAVYYAISVMDDQKVEGTTAPFFAQAAALNKFTIVPSVTDPPAGSQVVISAHANDTYGNPVSASGRLVHWTFTGPGGSLSSVTSATDGAGVASVVLNTSTVPGVTYSVSATDDFGNTGSVSAITTVSQMALANMAVGVGAQTTCGIATDGSAWCWGFNANGGLGNGTMADRPLPGKVGGNHSMTSLSAGVGHACGVSGGSVVCWGQNDVGQLGNGTTISSVLPGTINSTASFSSISAGAIHTCAVAISGDAYCWGSPNNGRLGDGGLSSGLTPVKVSGGLSFMSVSAGLEHTCGLTTAGDAYCWGSNSRGKLGNGTLNSASTPQLVIIGLKFTAISVGDLHSCALSAGKAYCWGDDSRGQLGTGSVLLNRSAPTEVASSENFTTISAGGYHTCAITADGRAFCWGDNSSGQLGDPTTTAISPLRSSPTLVAGGLTFKSIVAGGGLITEDYYYYSASPGGHTCGVTTNGVAYCWGSNISGELGISPITDWRNTPTKVSGQQ